jgi:hypothetical protein
MSWHSGLILSHNLFLYKVLILLSSKRWISNCLIFSVNLGPYWGGYGHQVTVV